MLQFSLRCGLGGPYIDLIRYFLAPAHAQKKRCYSASSHLLSVLAALKNKTNSDSLTTERYNALTKNRTFALHTFMDTRGEPQFGHK